jgi:succinoglycan biosynthesis transport protein ExoP
MAVAAHANGAGVAPRNGVAPRRLEVRDVVRSIQKRRWIVLASVVLISLIGGVVGATAPKRYSATSVVLVHTVPPGYFWVEQGQNAPPQPEIAIRTQARLVSTLENAQTVAKRLSEASGTERVSVTPLEIIRSVTVAVEEPDILHITASSKSRAAVVPMANEIANVFVEQARERSRGILSAAGDFLEEQIGKAEEKIEDLNDKRLALLEDGEIGDINLEISGTGQLLQQLKSDRTSVEQQLKATRQSLPVLRRAVNEEPTVEELPAQQPNPQRQYVERDLDDQMQELAQLRARYTEEHPLVQEALEEVEALQNRLDQIPNEVPQTLYRANPKHDQALSNLRAAEATAASLEAQLGAINGAITEVSREAENLPPRQVELSQLDTDLSIAEGAYRRLLDTLQQHQLRQASRAGAAEVVDEAGEPKTITAPLVRTMIFAVLLGLFCGIALAMLLEALDNTIRSPDEVARQTGLPLLGVIPLLEDTTEQVITLSAPQSPASEAFRTLRSNISFAMTDLPARSFLVCSAQHGEGKSSVAANLGVVMAHAGQSVILADTDLRKPLLAALLNCDPGRGITNVLVGDTSVDDVLQETGVPGLRLIATGPLPPNPAELLDSARMTQLLDELVQRADVVIFDSPPALLLADGIIMSSKADQTLLVAESGQVTVEAFREAMRLVEHARGSVLGVVLCKYRMPTGSYYQYYYEEPEPAGLSAPE